MVSHSAYQTDSLFLSKRAVLAKTLMCKKVVQCFVPSLLLFKYNADSSASQCPQITPTKAYFTSEKLFALHVNQACLKWPGEETGSCGLTPLCDLSSSTNVCFTSVSGGIHYMNRH